jgi:hypothetical protein
MNKSDALKLWMEPQPSWWRKWKWISSSKSLIRVLACWFHSHSITSTCRYVLVSEWRERLFRKHHGEGDKAARSEVFCLNDFSDDVMKRGSLWRQPLADVMKRGSLWRQPLADVMKRGSSWRQPLADVIKTNGCCVIKSKVSNQGDYQS